MIVAPSDRAHNIAGNERVAVSAIPTLQKPLKTTRSAITNGSRLLAGEVDGRTAPAKRYRDILAEISSDVGGPDIMSEAQRQLARLAAALSVEAEQMAAKSISGEVPLDVDAFGALSDRLGRVFNRLGLRRVAKTVGPRTITEYAAQLRERGEI